MPLNGQFQPLGPVIFLQAPSSLLKGVSMSHLRCSEHAKRVVVIHTARVIDGTEYNIHQAYHQNPFSKEIFS